MERPVKMAVGGGAGLTLMFLLNAHLEQERVNRSILERLAAIEAISEYRHGHDEATSRIGAAAAARAAAAVAESGVAAAATPLPR